MCANITELKSTLKTFEALGIELLHIDVMDGHFVPNFTLGTDYIKNLRKYTHIPLDIHLMVENPENMLDYFTFSDGDWVSVHIESTRHLQKVLSKIRSLGAKPMVALNPATPISAIENILDDIDGVLIMSVNPGFAGQKLIPATLKKAKALREWLDSAGYRHIEIEIDGNVSFENAPVMVEAGANIFVVGTSSVFSSKTTLAEGIKRFRAIINSQPYTDEDILSDRKKAENTPCACGRPHICFSKVYVGEGEIEKIADRVADYAAKKVYLVADKNTYAAAGERASKCLLEAGVEVLPFVFSEDRPIPDQNNVGLAVMNLKGDCDAVIGVGSGVINDICKIVAKTANLPLIAVATAPSMDGYASATSSMEMDGLKISLPSKAPDTIIGDLGVLASAPIRMLSSGIGDMLAKYVSICEWRIAQIIRGEYYCEEVASIMRAALKACVNAADKLLSRDKAAVKAVFEGLVLSGVATEYAGVSRPASGVEHYISHVFDMRGVSFGTKTDFHGIQCAIATLVSVRAYEKLRKITPNRENAKDSIKAFDYEKHSAALTDFIGGGAKHMIELEKKEQKYSPDKHSERLEIIIDNWDKILGIIEEELPSSESLEKLLNTIGLPADFNGVGMDNSLVPTAFEFSKDIRDKYVLSHLAWDLGIPTDELIN